MSRMHRVLVASDDDLSAAWLRAAVEVFEVSTDICRFTEFEKTLLERDPALVIADAGLEPENVVMQAERLSSAGPNFALLLVVEQAALDRVVLPQRMRSDIFVRGGSSAELATRARLLLWPGEEVSTDEIIRSGELTVNLASYQAFVRGEPVDFTYLEYALFVFLVTHAGRVYSREALLARVWGSDYVGGPRTVDVHVRRIRAKIGPELARRLRTVRNVGYMWSG